MPIDTRCRSVRLAAHARSRRAWAVEPEVLEGRRLLATFMVNSLADVLNPPAGVVTLRSAIEMADQSAASGVSNTIDLALTGTYAITTLGRGSTDNSAGEFAITGADGYNLTISNISGGRATIDGGGLNRVFDINPAASPAAFQVTLQDLTITGGVANGDGGGVRSLGAASVELHNTDLIDNVASGGGGGISASGGLLYFFNSTVVGNDASHGGGGATDASAETFAHNSVFEGNVATNFGGALDIGGTGKAGLSRDTFTANEASSGGAIADEAGTTSLGFTYCTLDDNRAVRGDGGALYAPLASGDSAGFNSCLLLDNSASDGSLGSGGAIDQTGGFLGFSNSQFSGNTAVASGGAIEFRGTRLSSSSTTIDHSRAGGDGGAIDFAGTGAGTFGFSGSSLIDDTLAFNSAAGGGGAIYDAASGGLGLLYDTINDNDGSQGGGIDLTSGGILEIAATIVARDTANLAGLGPDVLTGPMAQVTDQGSNLVGDASGSAGFNPGVLIGSAGQTVDPELGPLLDNGAKNEYVLNFGAGAPGKLRDIETEALATTSPAFQASRYSGSSYFTTVTIDERGFTLSSTTPSIGAYQPHYAATATPAQVYVEDLYEILLNRTADPGGLAYWSSQVASSGVNGGLIQKFESSVEYRSDQITSYYATDFYRLTNRGEVSSWLNTMDTEGLTLAEVQADFIGSPEYSADYGSNVAFVAETSYEEVLNRVPLASEVDAWVRASQMGAGPDVVALDFVLSEENEADLVKADYSAFLGRTASVAEVDFWLKAIAGSTDPKSLLNDAILGSPEAYKDRT